MNHRQQSIQDFVTALAGQGLGDAPHLLSNEQAARTIPVSQANKSARTNAKATLAHTAKAPAISNLLPQRKVVWLLGGLFAIFVSFVIAVYFYQPESATNPEITAQPAVAESVPVTESIPDAAQPVAHNSKPKVKLSER